MRKPTKLYVVKKYIMATSAAQAMKLEKRAPVDSVWIDEEWSKGNAAGITNAIGYLET